MFFINPFIYAGGGDFESIATVTVGSGGATEIEFTSIPSTYQHLQLRIVSKSNSTAAEPMNGMPLRLNGATTNYRVHELRGNGSSASAFSGNNTYLDTSYGMTNASGTSSMFGVTIIDILDYASASKTKVIRSLSGGDANGTVGGYGGHIAVSSGLWNDTSVISSIALRMAPGWGTTYNFVQYSTAALYGVKAP